MQHNLDGVSEETPHNHSSGFAAKLQPSKNSAAIEDPAYIAAVHYIQTTPDVREDFTATVGSVVAEALSNDQKPFALAIQIKGAMDSIKQPANSQTAPSLAVEGKTFAEQTATKILSIAERGNLNPDGLMSHFNTCVQMTQGRQILNKNNKSTIAL